MENTVTASLTLEEFTAEVSKTLGGYIRNVGISEMQGKFWVLIGRDSTGYCREVTPLRTMAERLGFSTYWENRLNLPHSAGLLVFYYP